MSAVLHCHNSRQYRLSLRKRVVLVLADALLSKHNGMGVRDFSKAHCSIDLMSFSTTFIYNN